jgi:hypothetical protein
MPPAYEVLLLNTAVPQIQAAQSGDTYVVPRDIAFSTVASFAAGTEALPSLVATGDVNTGFWFPAADTIAASTGGTRRLTLDASGNLGLGVTPSAWSGIGNTLQVNTGGSFSADAANAYFAANSYYNGTNWIYQTTNNATRYTMAANSHLWYTAPSGTAGTAITFTQAMTLDASGRLLIGQTADKTQEVMRVSGSGQASLLLDNTGKTNGAFVGAFNDAALLGVNRNPSTGVFYNTSNYAAGIVLVGSSSTSYIAFETAAAANTIPTERARITSGGDLLVGINGIAYNAERLSVYKAGNAEAAAFVNDAGANNYTVAISNRATTGDNKFVVFATESSDTTRGSITYNRAGGLVAYNTTSDYRAKDILGPVTNTGATIDALKVYNGKMKGATVERPMLIAHEAQEFAPYAVVGKKDAVNENGDPVFQQMDVSSLVPLLIAEIQSLRARVAQLEQGA